LIDFGVVAVTADDLGDATDASEAGSKHVLMEPRSELLVERLFPVAVIRLQSIA
jgi:hypothetical protein